MGALTTAEAYEALSAFAGTRGPNALLLMLHASVPETLRSDLLHLLQINFLAGVADPSLEADVLFSPFTTCLGGDYYRVDAQVRWHGLALLRSLYREDHRGRDVRVAELLWRHLEELERGHSIPCQTMLADYIAVQRWVALAYLAPSDAARAFAQALRDAEAAPIAAYGQLGGLAAALELPLVSEPELLTYAKGLDAMAKGDEPQATHLLEALGDQPLVIGDIRLRPPTQWLGRSDQPLVALAPWEREAALPPPVERHQLFISYSHADREWVDRLKTMLAPLLRDKELRLWDDSQIHAGSIWEEEIATALATAKVALLLVSPDFLNSEFIHREELPPILRAAQEEGMVLLWVKLRPCLVHRTP
ncbi:MAG: toll/interleukin-1 receptor domain-containing protein, partial [Cyanobacteriota bacterium]